MPEKLVAVFAPNNQNIDGVVEVIRRSDAHRRASRDPRSLLVFPLASRIDSGASLLRNLWWKGGLLNDKPYPGYQKIFEDLFTELYELDLGSCDLSDYFDATTIPHDKDYAFGEQIAARSHVGSSDKFSIGTACAKLTERLVKLQAPWEKLPQAQLEEALKQASVSTQRVEELEQERSRWIRRAGAVGIAMMTILLGSVSAFISPVLSDQKFFWIGSILTAGTALLLASLVALLARRRMRTIWAKSLVVAAVIVGGLSTSWWWRSEFSPSQPASKAAGKLLRLLNAPGGATAQARSDSISVQVSNPARKLAGQLTAADSKYVGLLALNFSDSVPLDAFNSVLGELGGDQKIENPVLGATLSGGVGPLRFGVTPENLERVLPLRVRELPSIGLGTLSVGSVPLAGIEKSITSEGESKIPASNASTSLGSSVPAQTSSSILFSSFHECWGGQSSVVFLFSNGGLTRISVRFFQDCPSRVSLLQNFASAYGITFHQGNVVPFQAVLPQSTISATNGTDFSSLEIFSNQPLQPANQRE